MVQYLTIKTQFLFLFLKIFKIITVYQKEKKGDILTIEFVFQRAL
jgi:hypothetical protein